MSHYESYYNGGNMHFEQQAGYYQSPSDGTDGRQQYYAGAQDPYYGLQYHTDQQRSTWDGADPQYAQSYYATMPEQQMDPRDPSYADEFVGGTRGVSKRSTKKSTKKTTIKKGSISSSSQNNYDWGTAPQPNQKLDNTGAANGTQWWQQPASGAPLYSTTPQQGIGPKALSIPYSAENPLPTSAYQNPYQNPIYPTGYGGGPLDSGVSYTNQQANDYLSGFSHQNPVSQPNQKTHTELAQKAGTTPGGMAFADQQPNASSSLPSPLKKIKTKSKKKTKKSKSNSITPEESTKKPAGEEKPDGGTGAALGFKSQQETNAGVFDNIPSTKPEKEKVKSSPSSANKPATTGQTDDSTFKPHQPQQPQSSQQRNPVKPPSDHDSHQQQQPPQRKSENHQPQQSVPQEKIDGLPQPVTPQKIETLQQSKPDSKPSTAPDLKTTSTDANAVGSNNKPPNALASAKESSAADVNSKDKNKGSELPPLKDGKGGKPADDILKSPLPDLTSKSSPVAASESKEKQEHKAGESKQSQQNPILTVDTGTAPEQKQTKGKVASVQLQLPERTEQERLQFIQDTHVLGAKDEEVETTTQGHGSSSVLDRVVARTAKLLRMPVCILSLVEREMVVWKCKYGLDRYLPATVYEERRSQSADAWVISQAAGKACVIQDTNKDSTYANTPLTRVGLNFYAGVALISSKGHRIGVLSVRCPLAQRPNGGELSQEEQEILLDMGQLAMGVIEARGSLSDMKSREAERSFAFDLDAMVRDAVMVDAIDSKRVKGVIDKTIMAMRSFLSSSHVVLLDVQVDLITFSSILRSYACSHPCKLTDDLPPSQAQQGPKPQLAAQFLEIITAILDQKSNTEPVLFEKLPDTIQTQLNKLLSAPHSPVVPPGGLGSQAIADGKGKSADINPRVHKTDAEKGGADKPGETKERSVGEKPTDKQQQPGGDKATGDGAKGPDAPKSTATLGSDKASGAEKQQEAAKNIEKGSEKPLPEIKTADGRTISPGAYGASEPQPKKESPPTAAVAPVNTRQTQPATASSSAASAGPREIGKVLADVVWVDNLPSSVIIICYAAGTRSVATSDIRILKSVMPPLSTTLASQITTDFIAAATQFVVDVLLRPPAALLPSPTSTTSAANALTPVSTQMPQSVGGAAADLCPFVLIVEPVVPTVHHDGTTAAAGSVSGAGDGGDEMSPQTGVTFETARHVVDLLVDFGQMFDVLTSKHGMSRTAKRIGNKFIVVGNLPTIPGVTATAQDLAELALELVFTLRTYEKQARLKVAARIGIHAGRVVMPAASGSRAGMVAAEEAWASVVHLAYQLATVSEDCAVVVSKQVRNDPSLQHFEFASRPAVILRGNSQSQPISPTSPSGGGFAQEPVITYTLTGHSKVPTPITTTAASPQNSPTINSPASASLTTNPAPRNSLGAPQPQQQAAQPSAKPVVVDGPAKVNNDVEKPKADVGDTSSRRVDGEAGDVPVTSRPKKCVIL